MVSALQAMSFLAKFFSSAWSNLATVAESVSKISQDVSGLVESQKSTVGDMFSSLEQTSRSLREFADEVKDNPSLLLRPRDPEPLPETAQ